MNSCFATIGAGNPWPRFRPCSASEPGANLHPMSRSAAPLTFPLVRRCLTPSYCVLLKQPDKQKSANIVNCARALFERHSACLSGTHTRFERVAPRLRTNLHRPLYLLDDWADTNNKGKRSSKPAASESAISHRA